MRDKPLWIPLRKEYFLAFERGEKTIEYRRHCPQWSGKHVYPGRPALLGNGYSGRRLHAVVVKLETKVMDSQIYGPQVRLSLIHLRVLGAAASQKKESRAPTSANRSR
jgi:hypothetical protein